MRTLDGRPAKLLGRAAKNLRSELKALSKGEKSFLGHYRKARLHAFEIEFLAKFFRKSTPANLEIFERLNTQAKSLEDELGAFNEIDEMLFFCQKHELTAAQVFAQKREGAYQKLIPWLKAGGWWDGSATNKIKELIDSVQDFDLRQVAIKKMSKVLTELQSNIDDGAYDPKRKSGYRASEIEPKVHEVRREIRKIPMYASYLDGVFVLTDKGRSPFKDLLKTSLAKSPFAQLPKTQVPRPLRIQRADYLAITRYVSELGNAKDWAQNLARLQSVGGKGQIHMDQLDAGLRNAFGEAQSLDHMVSQILKEISETQIFGRMAKEIQAQR